jgi:MYXO-CTERM domain-containing protein
VRSDYLVCREIGYRASMRRFISTLLFFGGLFTAASSQATDFYIDPAKGDPTGDGSAGKPWRTLQEVVEANLIETRHWSMLPYQEGATLQVINAGAPIKAGDTVWLRSGFHGDLFIRGGYNEKPIVIAAEAGQSPQLGHVTLSAASQWTLRGLSLSPSHAPMYTGGTIVDIENHGFHGPSSDIVIADCDIFSVDDASGWSAMDWVNVAASAVGVDGARVTVQKNRIRNVRFGISVGGEDAFIAQNTIDGFSADGLRGLGNGDVFEYNVIKNVHVADPEDANHDDGFQSWSVGAGGVGTGEVLNITLRGNVFINREDPNMPFPNSMQGIGCFDGFFSNWVVENNVVITDHWHGISFLGMRDSRIVNNTVIDINDIKPGPPWIMVNPHKNGQISENVVVRNNLAMDYALEGMNITDDANVTVTDPAAFFVKPPYDAHLLPTSAAIDAGKSDMAPPLDADRIPRPQGNAIDLGAYEWHTPDVEPIGGAGGAAGQGGGGAVGGGAAGGNGGGAAGEGSNGGSGGNPANGDEGTCGCRVVGDPPVMGWNAAWFVGLAIALEARRRRRSNRREHAPT